MENKHDRLPGGRAEKYGGNVMEQTFLRMALMIGASQLTKQMLLDYSLEVGNKELSGQPAART